MNYALNISNKVEDVLRENVAQKMEEDGVAEISESEEEELYRLSVQQVLEADGRAWADGDIRVGEYILIIDSDTRVVSRLIPKVENHH